MCSVDEERRGEREDRKEGLRGADCHEWFTQIFEIVEDLKDHHPLDDM